MVLRVVYGNAPVYQNIGEDVGFISRVFGIRAYVGYRPYAPHELDPSKDSVIYIGHGDPAFPSIYSYPAMDTVAGIATLLYISLEGFLLEVQPSMKYIRYVAMSNYVRSRLEYRKLHVVDVVHPGIDFTLLRRVKIHTGSAIMKRYGIDREKRIVALTIARDLPSKGFPWYAKVISRVAEKDRRIKFFIVTTPGADRHFERLGNAVAVAPIYGTLEREEMLSLIASSHIYVMPSLAEGFGMPVLEAMALGVPAVHADLPPLTEFSVGFYVNAKDVIRFRQKRPYHSWIVYEHFMYDTDEFADTVIYVADLIHRETLDDYRARATEKARQFDATQQYKKLIRHVVKDI